MSLEHFHDVVTHTPVEDLHATLMRANQLAREGSQLLGPENDEIAMIHLEIWRILRELLGEDIVE